MKTSQVTSMLLRCMIVLLGIFPAQAQTSQHYWDKNVAILDMRTRSVSNTAYVREIVVRDFSGIDLLSPNFGFGADLFADNGKSFDLAVGDGVYTSERCYAHHVGLPFITEGNVFSVISAILIDADFQYLDQLTAQLALEKSSQHPQNSTSVIKCNLKNCACPSACICFACEWGAATWCLDWSDCFAEVRLSW